MRCIPTFRCVSAAALLVVALGTAKYVLADESHSGSAGLKAAAAQDGGGAKRDDGKGDGSGKGKGNGKGKGKGKGNGSDSKTDEVKKEDPAAIEKKIENWSLGFKEGSPEHVVQRFCRKTLKGNKEGYEELIKSGVTDRLLRSLRTGTIADAQLSKLQDSLLNAKLDKKESVPGGLVVLLKNGDKETIQFSVLVLKEGEGLIQGVRIRD